MKRILLPLLFLLLHPAAVSASDLNMNFPNRYSNMADTLFDMIDAFASAFQKKKNEYNPPQSPYYYSPSPGYGYGNIPPPISYPSPGYLNTPQVNQRLNGQWKSNTGEILIIRQDRFRIYRDRENYHDGFIRIQDERTLIIQDAVSGSARTYEYAEQSNRLAMQDKDGHLLLYVRIGY